MSSERRRRRSRRHSDTSTSASEPPEQPIVFFVDHCLGRIRVPAAVVETGFAVELLSDHHDTNAVDAAWIPRVAERGWVILTRDRNILRNPLELHLVMGCDAAYVCLRCERSGGEEQAALLREHLGRLARVLRVAPRPVLVRISRSGMVIATQSSEWEPLRARHENPKWWQRRGR
jgi:hypothetical protein